MNILILGGTAFIGRFVTRQLTAAGSHSITLFNRGTRHDAVPVGVNVINGDRAEIGKYAEPLRATKPDVVLDMAPLSDIDSLKVVDLFRDYAGRTVMISSCDVYRAYDILCRNSDAPPDAAPMTEDASLREKLYPYSGHEGVSDRLKMYDKILAERTYLGVPELPGTVLRLPMVYGPFDYQHRLLRYVVMMDAARPAILLNDDFACWRSTRGYVEDVAHAITLAVTNPRAAGEVFNAGEQHACTEEEWVKKIGGYAGWGGQVVRVPETLQQHHTGMNCQQDLTIDTTKIRRQLGFAEITPETEAYRRTLEFERSVPCEKLPPDMLDFTSDDEILAAIK